MGLQFLGPAPGAMQDTKHDNRINMAINGVRDDVAVCVMTSSRVPATRPGRPSAG